MSGVTTTYVNDVNRSLPVVLDDGSRKYVWGLGLAYAVEGTSLPARCRHRLQWLSMTSKLRRRFRYPAAA